MLHRGRLIGVGLYLGGVRSSIGAQLAIVPAALALVFPGAASGASPTPVAAPWVRLSDEHTYTRWAHPRTTTAIRAAPLSGAAIVGRLRPLTEDGEPEVYELLNERTGTTGETWVQLRIPGRPNGRIGWVMRD